MNYYNNIILKNYLLKNKKQINFVKTNKLVLFIKLNFLKKPLRFLIFFFALGLLIDTCGANLLKLTVFLNISIFFYLIFFLNIFF